MNWKYEYKKYREKLCLTLANWLPDRIKYWAFILVSGADGNCPRDGFKETADYWCNTRGL